MSISFYRVPTGESGGRDDLLGTSLDGRRRALDMEHPSLQHLCKGNLEEGCVQKCSTVQNFLCQMFKYTVKQTISKETLKKFRPVSATTRGRD